VQIILGERRPFHGQKEVLSPVARGITPGLRRIIPAVYPD
jgi:hypothetical protein